MPSLPFALTLLLLLTLPGCKQKRVIKKQLRPLPLLEATLRVEKDAARALELAEGIKCRRLGQRLRAAGVVPRRLPPRDRIPLPPLAPHEAVLSMFQADGQLRLFWATSGRVTELAAPSLGDLEPRLILARDQLEYGEPRGGRLWGELRSLHRLLFGQVAGRLGQSITRLMVLPDGLARYLPLHALFDQRDASGRPRFLARDVVVSYAPCLAFATRHAGGTGSATVVLPGYGAPSRPLGGSRLEAAMITRLMSGARVVQGASATPAALEGALTGEAGVVHFSGHGLAALEPDSPPELVFGGGKRSVTVRSVGRLKVSAPLVVLSSCTTAYVARFRDGKRLMARVNLAEALLAAGARQVVAASWTAKDHWTTQQMKVFYAHLRKRGPAAALAEAHRHGIRRLVPPNPRFWAPHALHGAW